MLLPLSLLSFLPLLLSTSAVPVTASHPASKLTPDNFASTTAKGLWFVEHFSPYCVHCKHFRPTWETLVEDTAKEMPEVGMGTVNCAVHGDLCDKNAVTSYPSLFLFENGQKIDEFKGARDLDLLKEYLQKHLKVDGATSTSTSVVVETTKQVELAEPHTLAKPHTALNPSGLVLPLTPTSFLPTLALGPAFIKFYAPWCGHCKKLAPTWAQLARHMQGQATIAEVNCDEHKTLCAAHGVQGYPTLVWFAGGETEEEVKKGRAEYLGGRKLEALKGFVGRASAAGVQPLQSDADLATHIASDDVVFLLLHQPSHASISDVVRAASAPLLGSPPIFSSSSPGLFAQFDVPKDAPWALVAIKDHDSELPSPTYTPSSRTGPTAHGEKQKIEDWLLTHRLPTALELTQDSFQRVMNAPQKPLVVIAAASEGAMKDRVERRIRDVGKKWRVRTEGTGRTGGSTGGSDNGGREVVWSVMDRTRWGTWLKSMYGIGKEEGEEGELDDVRVVVADQGRLVYYDTDHAGTPIKFTSSASLFAAVEDAAAGLSTYKNSENFVERVARRLNAYMSSVESTISTHPFKSVLFVLGFIVAVIWLLNKLMGPPVDAYTAAEEWRESKGKNGRLD